MRGEPIVAGVLAATLEELARVGYLALRIEDVARTAGVNKTTVYRRWPTKLDLVRSALTSMRDHHLELLDTGSLRGDLMVLGRCVAEFANSAFGKSLVRVLVAQSAEPEVASLAKSLRDAKESFSGAIIANAIARGEIPEGTDPALLLETFKASVHQKLFFLHEPVDDTFLERLVDLLLQGVLTPLGRERDQGSKAERKEQLFHGCSLDFGST